MPSLLLSINPSSYRLGFLWSLQILTISGMPFSDFCHWFNTMSYDARRHRLNSWLVWYGFCEIRRHSVAFIRSFPNPHFLISNFLLYMAERDFPNTTRRNAKTAAVFLVEQLCSISNLGKHRVVVDFVASTSIPRVAKPKYKTIWDLDILLNYIRRSPPLASLSNNQLIARVVALFMIFAMARPVEVFRLDPRMVSFSPSSACYTFTLQRKTDRGTRKSSLSLHSLPEHSICPILHWKELLRRSSAASSSSSPPSLFFWDSGKLITKSSHLCIITKSFLAEAGIPKEYSTYSIRHATITKLYSLTGDKTQVNAFSGHSELAGTSSKFYLHQTENWLGFKLASASASSPSPDPSALLTRRHETDGSPIPLSSLSEGAVSSDDSSSDDQPPPQPVAATRARSVSPQTTATRTRRTRKSVQTMAALNPDSPYVYY